MNKEAIFHENTNRYVYAKSRECLAFKIRVGKKDIKRCRLCYWARTSPEEKKHVDLHWLYRDELFDYYGVDVNYSKIARYQKYYFLLEDRKGLIKYLTVYGLQEKEPEDGFFEYLYANQGDCVQIPAWAKGQIFYQIFPERFCNGSHKNDPVNCEPWGSPPTRENYMGGDIRGIILKLDYIKELGAQCLYLNPIFKGDFNHKYATTDYFEIDDSFGTKEEFRELVGECHKRGIKILLDGVFNHTGIHFEPFEDILKNQEKSCYKDWFYITEFPVTVSHHNYECVGAYKWMPKLNTSNPEVREYILTVMNYWIEEFHIDGWRLDVADEVDGSVWQEARIHLKAKYPHILLLGETWGYGLRLMTGNQMDIVMNYIFRDAARDFFALESINPLELDHRLNHMLATYLPEANDGLFNLLDSHDTERFLFLSGGDIAKLKMAAGFQFLFPGAPSIYYGDEIGMTGGNDPDCRRAMEWEEGKQNKELLKWYRTMAKIRREEECIQGGVYTTNICDKVKGIFGFVRYKEDASVYAVFNRSSTREELSVPVLQEGSYRDVLTGEKLETEAVIMGEHYYNEDVLAYGGKITVSMNPYSMKVIKKCMGGKEHEKNKKNTGNYHNDNMLGGVNRLR